MTWTQRRHWRGAIQKRWPGACACCARPIDGEPAWFVDGDHLCTRCLEWALVVLSGSVFGRAIRQSR